VLTLCFACTVPHHQSEPGLCRSGADFCLPGATKGMLTAEVSSVIISNSWHALLCSIITNAQRLVDTYFRTSPYIPRQAWQPYSKALYNKNHQEHFDHVGHSLPASQGQHEVYIVFQSKVLRCYHETLTLAVCREMDNLELTLINQEIVDRVNFWRLHVLNLEDFADEAGIPISPELRTACRLCDRYETCMLVMHMCKSLPPCV